MSGVLYFGDLDENPIIGKFNPTDFVQFEAESDSTCMWPDVEEVKEDEQKEDRNEGKDTSEYWKRRNRRRYEFLFYLI